VGNIPTPHPDHELDQRQQTAGDAVTRKRITGDAWSLFLQNLPLMTITKITTVEGMPSMAAVYKRRHQSPEFRQQLDAVLHDVRRERGRRIASSIRLAVARRDPEFIAKMDAGRNARLASLPRREKIKRERRVKRQIIERSISPTETFNAVLLRDELYAAASAAVPPNIRDEARRDIVADVVLAILEGEIDLSNVKERAPIFISRYRRMFGQRDEISLNLDGDARSFDEVAASIAGAEWHAGETNDHRRYRDSMRSFEPPTQIDDVYDAQVRRKQAELGDLGLSFEEAERELLGIE
jgi:hypothetical protein